MNPCLSLNRVKSVQQGDITNILYFETRIVAYDPHRITLNSGGRPNFSLKLKLNAISKSLNLGFRIFEKQKKWLVEFKGKIIPFTDGVELKR